MPNTAKPTTSGLSDAFSSFDYDVCIAIDFIFVNNSLEYQYISSRNHLPSAQDSFYL